MYQNVCSSCEIALTEDLDTFGPLREELCFSCYVRCLPDPQLPGDVEEDDYQMSLELEAFIFKSWQG